MRTRNLIRTISASVATAALLVLPTAAFASQIGDDFAVTCTGGDGASDGDTIPCAVQGLDASTPYKVTATNASEVVTLAAGTTATANGTTDADGKASFEVTATGDGDVVVTVEGTRNGESVSSSEEIDAAPDATDGGTDGEGVADTGADAGVLGMVALGALAIGGGALFASRRQRATTAA